MPAAPDRADFELPRFLPYLLTHVATRVSEDLSRMYAEQAQLAMPDFRVLVWLHHLGRLSAQEVAEHAGMDKATVSRAVVRLEERELISRATDPGDHRSRTLALTRKGRGLLTRLLPRVLDWEASLLAPFSATERRQLTSLLAKLEARLDVLSGDGEEASRAGD